MRVLILGGNGFIGFEVCVALRKRGHQVAALARNPGNLERRLGGIEWIRIDLRTRQTPADWALLDRFDAVVNCAGALQDGAGDAVVSVQRNAMLALYEAASAAGTRLIVQISARTDGPGADSDFLATKRQADTALRRSGVPFVLLRPAVVIGRNAYGGSALLRALAAMPWRTPLVHADTPMQFVGMADVTGAVAHALDGDIPAGSDLVLAAPAVTSLRDAVALHRAWLGLPAARTVTLPTGLAAPVAALADLLGWLGWRSPLRSTAMDIAAGGLAAASEGEAVPSLKPPAPLGEILATNPAGIQDLWFARLYLLKPVIIGCLAVFWSFSGLIALLQFDQSAAYLHAANVPPSAATALTLATAIADLVLGLGVAVRRTAGPSLKGMIALSLAYLAGATILEPALWADPLGPLLKILPSIVLAMVALAILEER